jgi:ribulose 1,5-bisphosphate carboxylase large subunit-like protein
MSWIRIRIYIVPIDDGARVTPDAAHRFIDQIRNDALYGTYGTLDREYWRDRMELDPVTLSEVELIGEAHEEDGGLAGYEFELRLNSMLFPPAMGGAPHLFGMLAGDLLRFTLPPIALKTWKIKEISFPSDWEAAEFDAFRGNYTANDIRSLRAAFKLQIGMPLLAFSFKPRVGFELKSLEDTAIQVLSAGFNIVELDTRHLPLDKSMLNQLVDLSSRVPDKLSKHVGRLSINLSMRSDLVIKAADVLCRDCPYPAIFKIDGGFNGFSSVQSIRGQGVRDGRKCGPIITCYPLVQNALAQYIPADQYVMRLAASGIDIIYPGGRPDIGGMVRSLQGAGKGNHVAPVQRYKNMVQKGWPMLSIAGGIYPGQLQAFYDVLGPDVAWFLGGGVALHKDGPRAGAELCVRIAKEAAANKAKAGSDWSDDISESLSDQTDTMFKDRSLLSDDQLRYVSPKTHLAQIYGLVPYAI